MEVGGESDGMMRAPTRLIQVMSELKELWSMVLPITAMNLVIFVRSLISVFCLGRLGSLELAGGALAIGFTNISGYSVLFGLAYGLEPVCSQAYGRKNWELMTMSLHRMIIILLFACLPIGLIWLNISKIMLLAGQDRDIAANAAAFCLYSLPNLLVHVFLQPIRVYLRSLGINKPMMYCAVATLILDVPLNFLLVFVLKLGVPGVAIAAELGDLNMVLLLAGYLYFSKATVFTWKGWPTVAVHKLWQLLALAVPSCVGICLEWWCYEIMTLLSGYLPDPKAAVATTAILMQTVNLCYTLSMSLGSCASTRVGIELGSGTSYNARLAAIVALGCSVLFGIFNVIWMTVLSQQWALIFTRDSSVLALAASAMPIMGFSQLGNGLQTTGCGVLRGMARPNISVGINLASFYALGTPLAIALAFWLRLGYNGIWFGLLTAETACSLSAMYVMIRTDWELESFRAKKLANTDVDHSCNIKELEIIDLLADKDDIVDFRFCKYIRKELRTGNEIRHKRPPSVSSGWKTANPIGGMVISLPRF
ncbi:hypothetical protein ACLOJK_001102 [Asimina triloba]